MLSGWKKYYLIERTVPLGEVRWLNNRESAPRIDLTAGEPASELLRIGDRQVTEMICEYVVYSGGEMLEGLIECAKAKAKAKFGSIFSRGVYIFPVLELKTQNSKLKTQNSKLKTQNSKLKTQNSKLKTQNPKFGFYSSILHTDDFSILWEGTSFRAYQMEDDVVLRSM